jgi:prepilin signal peptidase PulO-like enzyme (type II secretory pathway)
MLSPQTLSILSMIGLGAGWITSKLSVYIPNKLILAYQAECQEASKHPIPTIKIHPYQTPLMTLAGLYATLMPFYCYGNNPRGLSAMLLAMLMLTLAAIDYRTKLLPDWLIYIGLWLGLFVNVQHIWVIPEAAIIGALLGYTVPWLLIAAGKRVHKDIMGYGDCKMLAMLGAWFGPVLLPSLLATAALLAAVTHLTLRLLKKTEQTTIAFGPYLALAGLLMLHITPVVFQNSLHQWLTIKY